MFVFFFKQKTAYEMRISDWSSDVCSSDLHGPRPHKGVFAYGHAAHNSAVRAQHSAFFHQGIAVFVLTLHQRARVVDIGKHHAGAAEHTFFQSDVVVHGHVVLYFAPVANNDFIGHEHVLAQRHARAYAGARTHMNEVPDARAFAYLRAIVNDGGFVPGVVHFFKNGW